MPKYRLFGQVKVAGTGHGMRTSTPIACWSISCSIRVSRAIRSIQISGNPDTRTTWAHLCGIRRKPYSGAGAYMKVTKLQNPPELKDHPERVFIEYHLVFDEPNGWFGGGNNLIAKLPNRFDADVHKFREDLRDFEKKLAAGQVGGKN